MKRMKHGEIRNIHSRNSFIFYYRIINQIKLKFNLIGSADKNDPFRAHAKKRKKKYTHTHTHTHAGKIIPVCSASQSIEKLKNNCDVIVLRAMPAMNTEKREGEREREKERERKKGRKGTRERDSDETLIHHAMRKRTMRSSQYKDLVLTAKPLNPQARR